MDRSRELKDPIVPDLFLTGEDMVLIMKALDSYGYALMLSGHLMELYKIKQVEQRINAILPPPEYDA